jgi:hypothetical protein
MDTDDDYTGQPHHAAMFVYVDVAPRFPWASSTQQQASVPTH